MIGIDSYLYLTLSPRTMLHQFTTLFNCHVSPLPSDPSVNQWQNVE